MPPVFMLCIIILSHFDMLMVESPPLENLIKISLEDWSRQIFLLQQYRGIGLWTWDAIFLCLLPLWLLLSSTILSNNE